MTNRPLTGVDAQILQYLIQLARIGEHRGTWTAADVRRVAHAHLRPSLVPVDDTRPTGPRRKPRRDDPADDIRPGERRTVSLTPHDEKILEQMRAGRDADEAAAELHLKPSTALNAMSRITRACGARSRQHALRLIEGGDVTIHVRRKDSVS